MCKTHKNASFWSNNHQIELDEIKILVQCKQNKKIKNYSISNLLLCKSVIE